ncbi:MAG: urease accessory protein UreE [Gammaproteobacteria bacterium]|nr:urease accessory protein UreE [Gammaproteobacteria bacterium]
MLEIYERLGTQGNYPADTRVILTHEQRDRGRLRVFSPEGEEVRIFLTRGSPLLVGETLRAQCGRYVLVEGAIEAVAVARCDDWPTFARACYHLGNRHVKVQVGERLLRILPDHVLEAMLTQLGLEVEHARHVFVPESGAYAHGAHSHSHDVHSDEPRAVLLPVRKQNAVLTSIDTLEPSAPGPAKGRHDHH